MESSEDDDIHKMKIMRKYRRTVEKNMQSEESNSKESKSEELEKQKNKNLDVSDVSNESDFPDAENVENIKDVENVQYSLYDEETENEFLKKKDTESSFIDSDEDIIWSNKENTDLKNISEYKLNKENLWSNSENGNDYLSNNEHNNIDNDNIDNDNIDNDNIDNDNDDLESEKDYSNLLSDDEVKDIEKEKLLDALGKLESFEKNKTDIEKEQQQKQQKEKKHIKEETTNYQKKEYEENEEKEENEENKMMNNIDIWNKQKNDLEIKEISEVETKKEEMKKNMFEIEIKDKKEWMLKYRNLISTFRKLDKEIYRIVNNEHIEIGTKQSIKQHKEFLENDYKNWVITSQKAISEFQKNIGAKVSEQNEKEYAILSKAIFENFKDKSNEENNINFTLYLFILKYDILIDECLKVYFEKSYLTSSIADNILQNAVQKLIETNDCIHNIGGKTGSWNDDDNNYFLRVYENHRTLDNEVIVDILQKGINKTAEEIYEHISWYHKFLNYQHVKNKYLNNINIICDQKKNKSKDEEDKKNKIKEWKEKKKEEIQKKQKEKEKIKKEEIDIQRKIRETNLKKKQMIQEHLTAKKEEKKKKESLEKQKSVISKEMLQRINERNERIMQKKIQSNILLNEDNNEKEKKGKQKYTHVQSKLISNTDDILKRLKSTVDTIENIL